MASDHDAAAASVPVAGDEQALVEHVAHGGKQIHAGIGPDGC
jgi:hypothetical protein